MISRLADFKPRGIDNIVAIWDKLSCSNNGYAQKTNQKNKSGIKLNQRSFYKIGIFVSPINR